MGKLNIEKIRFGDPDALHEVTKQDSDHSRVFMNSFVAPPRANLDQLVSGSKYFIIGAKGTGKTAALLYLRDQGIEHKSDLILFKSNIRHEDRLKLDKLTKTVIVEDQNKFAVEADYRTVWEWYLLKSIVRLIDESDILEGRSFFKDIVLLLEADKRKFNTLYDSMKVESAKGTIKLKVGIGALQSEIGAEINARRSADDQIDLLDLVRLTQAALRNITLKHNVKCRLYIDELEFALETAGNGDRDRRMVRDLIISVYNTNMLFKEHNLDVICYACIRSEVIASFPGSNSEISKITRSFGIQLNWEPLAGQESSVLEIFSRKITNSEIEEVGDFSVNPWSEYFPPQLFGKDTKKYLLDMGSHRPRGVLLCLMAAADKAWSQNRFIEENFDDHDNSFAQNMLDEIKEELSASMFDFEIEGAISLLRGRHFVFSLSDIKSRMLDGQAINSVRKLRKEKDAEFVVRALFRCGMIGNSFKAEDTQLPRQIWASRGNAEPLLDKPFIVHQSLHRLLDMV